MDLIFILWHRVQIPLSLLEFDPFRILGLGLWTETWTRACQFRYQFILSHKIFGLGTGLDNSNLRYQVEAEEVEA